MIGARSAIKSTVNQEITMTDIRPAMGVKHAMTNPPILVEGTPLPSVRTEDKENCTPDTGHSDTWKGAPWTPADVSQI